MATKAERFKSEEERTGRGGRTPEKKPLESDVGKKKPHMVSKATHALEVSAPGKRPSRESTRSSANRAKSDSALNITEEVRKGAPTQIARKAQVRAKRVRGS